MAVRTIQQIQKELAVGDKSQRALINKQLKELPKLFQGQVKGLEAKQKNAFADILSGAKQRGLKFSGIPLAEQAEYTSDVFLPALAGLEEQRNTARTGLQGALADIIAQRSTLAQQLRQQELDRAFQAAEAAKSRAAAAASMFNPTLGAGGGNTPQSMLDLPGIKFKNEKAGGKAGYAFDFGGTPVSAAGWAALNGQTVSDVLYTMAQSGDATAARAYQEIVQAGGITPQIQSKYSSLFWQSATQPGNARANIGSTLGRLSNMNPNARTSFLGGIAGAR